MSDTAAVSTAQSGWIIARRIFARGSWVATSPLHVGAEDELGAYVDMALLRNEKGDYYIPGSSIAGAARSRLASRWRSKQGEHPEINQERTAIEILFGGGQVGHASPLTVLDAPLINKPLAYIRDGVRICARTGKADSQGKYNFEVLPPGSTFRIEFELLVYRRPPAVDSTWQNEDDAGAWLRELLELFHADDDGVRLGAKTSRGFGRGAVEDWQVASLDMSKREDVAQWLRRSRMSPDDWWKMFSIPAVLPRLQEQPPIVPERFAIDATFRLKTSLLIRQAGVHKNDPDAIQLEERALRNGRETARLPVPGTGLGGVLRRRAEQILKTKLAEASENANQCLNQLFGFVPDDKEEKAQASRVEIAETELQNVDRHVQCRVAIDRFTAGALEAALFDEAAAWPSNSGGQHLRISLTGENLRKAECGLLLLAFKDLWLGDLSIGGESSCGRGVVEGITATLTLPDGKVDLTLEKGKPVSTSDAERANQLVHALNRWVQQRNQKHEKEEQSHGSRVDER